MAPLGATSFITVTRATTNLASDVIAKTVERPYFPETSGIGTVNMSLGHGVVSQASQPAAIATNSAIQVRGRIAYHSFGIGVSVSVPRKPGPPTSANSPTRRLPA